ncbi:MAG: PAS domain S-box protein, partial [Chloroflexi bacterium]|nr:PAS domain S-box protein [Chloroflexota bacterium]
MMKLFKQMLAPPIIDGDEIKTYRARLINILLNSGLILVGLTFVGNFLDNSTPLRNFVIDFCEIGVFLLFRRMLFAGRVQFVARFGMAAAFFFQTISMASGRATLAPSTVFFPFLIILAGVLFDLRGVVVTMISSSLVVGGIILARQEGLLHPILNPESTFQWHIFTIIFGLTGVLAYFSQQLTQKMITRAAKEILDRKEAEVGLRKLTQAVEQSPVSIVITDLRGDIDYVNPHFKQLTGYRSDEVVGKNPRFLNTEFTPPNVHLQLWETITKGKVWRGEFVNQKKDGSLYYESAIISPITDLNGIATHYLAVKEDITERKQVENALLQSENRFRSLFEDSPLPMLEDDYSAVKKRIDELREEGVRDFGPYFTEHPEVVRELTGLIKINNINHATLVLHGAGNREELIENLPNLFSTEAETDFHEELVLVASGATRFELETINRTLDGKKIFIHLNWAVVPGYENDLSRVVVTLMDVTQRKQSEDALHEVNCQLEEAV